MLLSLVVAFSPIFQVYIFFSCMAEAWNISALLLSKEISNQSMDKRRGGLKIVTLTYTSRRLLCSLCVGKSAATASEISYTKMTSTTTGWVSLLSTPRKHLYEQNPRYLSTDRKWWDFHDIAIGWFALRADDVYQYLDVWHVSGFYSKACTHQKG